MPPDLRKWLAYVARKWDTYGMDARELRCDGKSLVECGHEHHNRDQSGGTSASDCIRCQIRATRLPSMVGYMVDKAATSWQSLTRGPWPAPTATVEAAKADSAREAAALPDRIAQLAAAIVEHDARRLAPVLR